MATLEQGVIVKVVPSEEMLTDADGNVAEIEMDADSVIKRMNLAKLYEQYVNAAGTATTKRIKEMIVNKTLDEYEKILSIYSSRRFSYHFRIYPDCNRISWKYGCRYYFLQDRLYHRERSTLRRSIHMPYYWHIHSQVWMEWLGIEKEMIASNKAFHHYGALTCAEGER